MMSARRHADIAFQSDEPMTDVMDDHTFPDSPQPGYPMANNLEPDNDEHVAPAPGEHAPAPGELAPAPGSVPLPAQASSQGSLLAPPLGISATASAVSVEAVVVDTDGDAVM
ncbi:hypothetical protein BGW39_008592 [Mortierella sp. 14UC]|nr:hypothetical protein BGW39_008592 [Mortierella sp. 14UC]